jgi:hypothetical protein
MKPGRAIMPTLSFCMTASLYFLLQPWLRRRATPTRLEQVSHTSGGCAAGIIMFCYRADYIKMKAFSVPI